MELTGFHKDSDIFTFDGWKNIAEIKSGDKLATLNPYTRIAEFLPCKDVKELDYSGNMIGGGVKKDAKAGFFITPESKALVYLESDPSPGFLKAKYLLNQKSIFYIAHINKFKGINKLKYKVKDVSVEGHDAAYLLGIIFAKGIITRNFIYFPLYQEEETSLKIKELLTKLGIKFLAKKNENLSVEIYSQSFCDYIETNLGKNRYERFISDKIKNLSSELLKSFVQGIFLCTKRNAVAAYKNNNNKCINDLYYILNKVGYRYIFSFVGYMGLIRCFANNDYSYNVEEIRYKDKIYSIIIEPYHTLLIRLGKLCGFWCGDSKQ